MNLLKSRARKWRLSPESSTSLGLTRDENMYTEIFIRFYEELNDFLEPLKRKKTFSHVFKGVATVKDIIESLGVPHTEVDLILVNGHSVDFKYKPEDQDKISVYPMFESLDISPILRLRPKPLREPKFVLDVHLGKLARRLRLLGFDTLYSNHYSDNDLVEISKNESRIILTRDVNLLKNKVITHGYWMRNILVQEQLKEVVSRFDLKSKISPFSRCLECNGLILEKTREEIQDQNALQQMAEIPDKLYECQNCRKIYWMGSHYDKMKAIVQKFID